MSIKTPTSVAPAGIFKLDIVQLDAGGNFDFPEAWVPEITVSATAPATPENYDIWIEMDKAVSSVQLSAETPATYVADYLLHVDSLKNVLRTDNFNTMLRGITNYIDGQLSDKMTYTGNSEFKLNVDKTTNQDTSNLQELLVTDFMKIQGSMAELKMWNGTQYDDYQQNDLLSMRYWDGTEWQTAVTYVLVYNGQYDVTDVSDMQLFADYTSIVEAVLGNAKETEVLAKAPLGLSEVFQRGLNWDKFWDMATTMEQKTYSEKILPEVASTVGLTATDPVDVGTSEIVGGFTEGVDYRVDYDSNAVEMLSLGSLEFLTNYTFNFNKLIESTGTFTPVTSSTNYSFATPVGNIRPAGEKVYATTDPATVFEEGADYLIDYANAIISVRSSGNMALSVEYTVEFDDLVPNTETLNFPETTRSFSKHHIDPTSLQIFRNEEPFTAVIDTAVNLENIKIVLDSERVYDPVTGEEFTKGVDYSMDYNTSGAITVSSMGNMEGGKEYLIDYKIDVVLDTNYTQTTQKEYEFVTSSSNDYLYFITFKKDQQLRKDREYEFRYSYLGFTYPQIAEFMSLRNLMAVGKLAQGGAFADGVGESAYMVTDLQSIYNSVDRTAEITASTRAQKYFDALGPLSYNTSPKDKTIENLLENDLTKSLKGTLRGLHTGINPIQGTNVFENYLRMPKSSGGANTYCYLDLTDYNQIEIDFFSKSSSSYMDNTLGVYLSGETLFYKKDVNYSARSTLVHDVSSYKGKVPIRFYVRWDYNANYVDINLYSIKLIK